MPATHTMYTSKGKKVSVDSDQVEELKNNGYTMEKPAKDPVDEAQ